MTTEPMSTVELAIRHLTEQEADLSKHTGCYDGHQGLNDAAQEAIERALWLTRAALYEHRLIALMQSNFPEFTWEDPTDRMAGLRTLEPMEYRIVATDDKGRVGFGCRCETTTQQIAVLMLLDAAGLIDGYDGLWEDGPDTLENVHSRFGLIHVFIK